MSVELQLIRASEFIRLDPHKHLDLEASKEALGTLARACRKRGIDCALLDLRTLPVLAKPHFTTAELGALVGAFREAGFSRQQRLAILYRQDLHGGIRSFAFISRMSGLQVQAFSEYEGAMHWLSSDSTRRDLPPESEVRVPIKQSRVEARRLPVSPTVLAVRNRLSQPVRRTRASHH